MKSGHGIGKITISYIVTFYCEKVEVPWAEMEKVWWAAQHASVREKLICGSMGTNQPQ